MQGINFFSAGNGFPLIFLHGFCESSKIWSSFSKEISRHYKVICPDLPGFGQSPLPTKQFSLEDIGDTIVNWLQSIGVEQAIVIGHSLGGYISLEILRKYPDFNKAIVLLNSSALADPDDKKENRNKLIQFIGEHGVAPFLKTFVPSLFYPPTAGKYQAEIEAIETEGLSIKPESVMWYAAAMRDRRDSVDLLKQHSKRILLIAGEHDQNVPLEKSREMAQYLLQDYVHIVPESSHMSLFEQTQICQQAIGRFADEIIS